MTLKITGTSDEIAEFLCGLMQQSPTEPLVELCFGEEKDHND